MRYLLIITLYSVFNISFSGETSCNHEKICKSMDNAITLYKQNLKSQKNFNQVLKVGKTICSKNCKLPGYNMNIAIWRACYDQGFNTINGKRKKSYKAKYSKSEVFEWFFTIKNSIFSDGKAFVNSKLFTSTLDGAYYLMFTEDQTLE